jgi:multiple sugar transport system substrate-binding protein
LNGQATAEEALTSAQETAQSALDEAWADLDAED